jgi:aminoglycoside phosphotransferase (APT) family kinase protein
MTAPTRTELFAGVEAPAPHLAIDGAVLSDYLASRIRGWRGPVEIKKFRGGQSNPTYRLETPGGTYVLRKKPGGVLLPSAHAIDREFRAISAVHAQGFPTPTPLLFCEDREILGTEFYVVEFVGGRVFWDAEMPGADAAQRTAVYGNVVDALARLHGFDVAELGLADYGKPGDYVGRQLSRWGKQYRTSQMADIPDMDWLLETLEKVRPAQLRNALCHGDFGLHNIIVHPDRPDLLAVLDWEISTLGDPLADLAHHLMPWYLPPDPERASVSTLVGRDLKTLGIPDVDSYIARYCEKSGMDGFPNRDFYIAFALFRYAAILQGILKRAAGGNASSKNMPHTQERVVLLAAAARRALG